MYASDTESACFPRWVLYGRLKAGTAGLVDASTRPKQRPDLRKPTIDLAVLRKVSSMWFQVLAW